MMAELLAMWCDWMGSEAATVRAAGSLRTIARTLKTEQFRLARVARGGRSELAATLENCAREWSIAAAAIARLCERDAGELDVGLPGDRSPLGGASERALSTVS